MLNITHTHQVHTVSIKVDLDAHLFLDSRVSLHDPQYRKILFILFWTLVQLKC